MQDGQTGRLKFIKYKFIEEEEKKTNQLDRNGKSKNINKSQ